MNFADPDILIELFRERAVAGRLEALLAADNDRFFDEQKVMKRKQKHEEEDRKRYEDLVLATVEQIGAFNDHLDAYDTATVQALMDNQTALDAVRHRRDALDAVAYRLTDGRPVFKTEDGTKVFDRNGTELSHDVIYPDTIPDTAPKWEAAKRERDTEVKLTQERQELHRFQQRLDEARETVEKGYVTADTLSRMDAALQRDMPDAVRHALPAAHQAAPISGAEAPSSPPEMSVEQRTHILPAIPSVASAAPSP